MRILDSRPALRWAAPLAFVLVAGGTGLVSLSATAEDKLPATTAEDLLVAVQSAEVDGVSGTVVQKANLGLPALPSGGQDSADLQSLVSGTHTLRVWYAGPDKARVSLLGDYAESSVISNGRDVWVWSSADKTAKHTVLPAGERREATPKAGVPSTPQEAAEQFLAAVGPTTEVVTDSDVTVARRAAYELVLRPKDDRSLIREVRLAVDGETYVPLRTQVFADGAEPALEVAYDSVDFGRPDDAQFEFNPPPGTEVTEVKPDAAAADKGRKQAEERAEDAPEPTVVGEGWTTVVVADGGSDAARADEAGGELGAFTEQLPRVSGDWGSGRLLAGTAFSAVLADDGRVAVGAVEPELLFEALDK